MDRIWIAIVAGFLAVGLAGCATVEVGDPDKIELSGKVVLEWDRPDYFYYRKSPTAPLTFKPSFLDEPIIPGEMYTDGGSIPEVFRGIPGLSPWAVGPAYILHDWLFKVKRCGFEAPPAEKNMKFRQSAQVLAEVAFALERARVISNDKLDLIIAAVNSRYAERIWESPASDDECRRPEGPLLAPSSRADTPIFYEFTIPPPGG